MKYETDEDLARARKFANTLVTVSLVGAYEGMSPLEIANNLSAVLKESHSGDGTKICDCLYDYIIGGTLTAVAETIELKRAELHAIREHGNTPGYL
jgi:hypothetical protein